VKTLYLRTARIDFPTWLKKNNRPTKVMVESIRDIGLINPIIVRRKRSGRYQVVDGILRLKAWKRLGHKRIRCLYYNELEWLQAVIRMNSTVHR